MTVPGTSPVRSTRPCRTVRPQPIIHAADHGQPGGPWRSTRMDPDEWSRVRGNLVHYQENGGDGHEGCVRAIQQHLFHAQMPRPIWECDCPGRLDAAMSRQFHRRSCCRSDTQAIGHLGAHVAFGHADAPGPDRPRGGCGDVPALLPVSWQAWPVGPGCCQPPFSGGLYSCSGSSAAFPDAVSRSPSRVGKSSYTYSSQVPLTLSCRNARATAVATRPASKCSRP